MSSLSSQLEPAVELFFGCYGLVNGGKLTRKEFDFKKNEMHVWGLSKSGLQLPSVSSSARSQVVQRP